MRHSVKAVLPAALVAVLALGCAQDLGTIDRVQQNVVLKTDLLFNEDGTRKEWYVQVTTVDAPYASAYSFVGDQGPMERGVFEIQESVLYFYRSYSFAENEWDGNPRRDVDRPLTNRDGTPYLVDGKEVWMSKNTPLLAYPITTHLDVIWEYNPNTGEKTNVRVENTSDRMWYEREYIRVKWGANMMASAVGHNVFGRLETGFAEVGAPSIYHDETSHPDVAPRMTDDGRYMDFVNDWLYNAQTEPLEGYGTVPLCWFYAWYSGGVYECVSERIRMRTSFLTVDPAREAEYEALQYNDFEMNRFGYFRAERLSWDNEYGFSYDGVRRLVNRYDIWKKDEAGNVIGVKPILFYLNAGYPDDLVEEGVLTGIEWSRAFDATVKAATGKDPIQFPAYRPDGTPMVRADGQPVSVQHMFIVCENNAAEAAARTGIKAETDESICGPMDEVKPLGDLRYSFLNAVTAPTQVGLYGYGPSSVDPLSGRIVKSAANNYVAAMRQGAQRALDRIELLSGVKSFREVADATYIAQEVRNDRLERSTYFQKGYTREEAEALAAKLVAPAVQSALTGGTVQKTDQNFTAARMSMLKANPDIEAMLVSDDVRLIFKDPRLGGDQSDGTLAGNPTQYALRNWANARGIQNVRKYYVERAKNGLDLAEFYDGAILRLADEYKVRFDQAVCDGLRDVPDTAFNFNAFNESTPCTAAALIGQLRRAFAYYNQLSPYGYERNYIPTPLEMETQEPTLIAAQKAMNDVLAGLREQFAQELYKRIYWGVAIHEVGHTLGLRHNFEASTDALNFPKEYWNLRVSKSGDDYVPVGLWGETPQQVAAGLREYQYSSVMDYYGKFNMPWLGLGLYDIAAIKYGYGRTVEVFQTNPDLSKYAAYLDVDPTTVGADNAPVFKERGEGLGLALRRVHATNYPNFWGDVAKMYDRRDVPIADILGEKCDAEGASCSGGKVCQRFYEGLRCTKSDLTMVPYRFGGDELTFGLPTVGIFDEGVDSYEIVNNLVELYENNWVFAGYWHQDPTYWPTNYDNSVRINFYQMRNHFQWWAINYSIYNKGDYWKNRFGKRWEEDINGGLPGSMAAYLSFNTMAGAFGRPEPNNYGYNWMTKRYEPVDQVNLNNYTTQFMLMEEAGARPIYSNWDYSGYQPVVTSSGSIYERLAAFEMLADPETWFMAQDVQADTRKFLVNYASVFRNEMRELFGGLMANNSEKYGWCVLTHPVTNQPVTFTGRDYVGMGYNGQDCANSYRACFTMNGDKADKLTRVFTFNDGAASCGSGEQLFNVGGISLEPEPLYTFPTTRFRIPMLAAYYGMALLVDNFDRSFMDATRLWIAGDRYAITPPAGAEVATCEDLFSGRVYTTYRMNDGRYYPAFDLVQQCDFLFSCYDPIRNDTLTQDETTECKSYARGTTAVKDLTLEDLRNDYLFHPLQFLVGKLELMRAMHATFDYPNSSYSYETGGQ